MQLRGPVPADLYHRYVEFKPFVSGMFTSHSMRGRLLNRALHHQHARIYNYDRTTKYGTFAEPNVDMTKLFLDLVHYDEGGRIFTYVLTLDGHLRFTETGKEFGIDLLSKHTMHSDVSIYIACSGEFFIRKVRHAKMHQDEKSVDPLEGTHKPAPESGAEEEERENVEVQQMSINTGGDDGQDDRQDDKKDNKNEKSDPKCPVHSAVRNYKDCKDKDNDQEVEVEGMGAGSSTNKDTDPSHYELIIDNDSGTYRPNAKKLPMLRDFLAMNFPGLKVVTLDCQGDEERMNKLKDEQRDRKKKSAGQVMFLQNSSMSSISSSDEEYLDARASGHDPKESRYKREYHKFLDGGRDQHHGDRTGADASNGQTGGIGEKENGEVHGMPNGAVGANVSSQHLESEKQQ